MGTTTRFKRVFGTAVGGAVLLSAATMWPASAAERVSHASAPYAAADHRTSTSCNAPNVAPSCGAASTADPASGRMDASSAVDSGGGGMLPGTAESIAVARINQTVDLGNATAATITFLVHVVQTAASSQKHARGDASLEANAECEQCTPATAGYLPLDHSGDQAVSVTVVRGSSGSRMATVGVSATATSIVDCEDEFFCTTPSGAAKASVQSILERVDVQLWGLGKPAAPTITSPTSGSTLNRSPDRTDALVSGTAEPGMLVHIFDRSRDTAEARADDSGRWYSSMDLPPGAHSLVVKALGPEGTSTSQATAVHVR